jgi:hypothetical protein
MPWLWPALIIAGVGGAWWKLHSASPPEQISDKAQAVCDAALQSLTDPTKLRMLAAAYTKAGFLGQAELLNKRANLFSQPADVKAFYTDLFKKAMASTKPDVILKTADHFESIGAFGVAGQLRILAAGVQAATNVAPQPIVPPGARKQAAAASQNLPTQVAPPSQNLPTQVAPPGTTPHPASGLTDQQVEQSGQAIPTVPSTSPASTISQIAANPAEAVGNIAKGIASNPAAAISAAKNIPGVGDALSSVTGALGGALGGGGGNGGGLSSAASAAQGALGGIFGESGGLSDHLAGDAALSTLKDDEPGEPGAKPAV